MIFHDIEFWNDFINIKFRGKKFINFQEKNYDFYLKQLYGDYMKLPPVEQRISKHRELNLLNKELASKK